MPAPHAVTAPAASRGEAEPTTPTPRGKAGNGNLIATTFNVGAKSPLANMGAALSSFRLKLRGDMERLCESSHVVGLQELNESHAAWLQNSLPAGWRMAGEARHGLHVLWDDRELTLVSLKAQKVFPGTAHDDKHRHWRRYLEAGAGRTGRGCWPRRVPG